MLVTKRLRSAEAALQLAHTRRGFTLVEVLVVIGIIAILVSIMLPAIQASREAAGRAQTTNNMRQLVIAATNFQSQQGYFPAGALTKPFRGSPLPQLPADGSVRHGWIPFLLPYLEQENIRAQYRFDRDFAAAENQTAINARIAVLQSAAAPQETRIGTLLNGGTAAASDFHPPSGISDLMFTPNPEAGYVNTIAAGDYQGIMGSNRLTRPAEITDGLTTTILFTESAGGSQLYRLGLPVPGGTVPGFSPFDPEGNYLVHGTCDAGGHYPGPYWNIANLGGPDREAFGFHRGVIIVGFAGGNVTAVRKNLDIRVFARLVGMKDGQVVTDSDY